MPLKLFTTGIMLLGFVLPAAVFSQIDVADSLVVREILDANGLGTVKVGSVISGGGGRIYTLYLDNLGLTVLPECLGKLDSLGNLQIQRNQLTSLPKSIGNLTKLRYLCAYENNLSELPDEIGACKKLETIYLIRNRFTKFPAVLSQLPSLESIYLSSNYLTEVPAEISTYQSLKSLSLNGNNLSTLPQQFLTMQPGTINIEGNALCSLSPEMEQWLSPNGNDRWRQVQACNRYPLDSAIVRKLLDANGWGDKTVAEVTLGSQYGINKIDVSSGTRAGGQPLAGQKTTENGILVVPADIDSLRSLYSFDVSGNRFSALSPSFVKLFRITQLDISNNEFSELPGFMTTFNRLTKLDVTGNRLKNLTPEVEAWVSTYDPDWRATQQTTRLQKGREAGFRSAAVLRSVRLSGSSVLSTVNFSVPTGASLYLYSFDGKELARSDERHYFPGTYTIEFGKVKTMHGGCVAVLKAGTMTSTTCFAFVR